MTDITYLVTLVNGKNKKMGLKHQGSVLFIFLIIPSGEDSCVLA